MTNFVKALVIIDCLYFIVVMIVDETPWLCYEMDLERKKFRKKYKKLKLKLKAFMRRKGVL